MRATPGRFQFRREIRSRLEQVDRVCRELRTTLSAHGLEARQFALELVARECLNNAVLHGNGENRRKRVVLNLSSRRDWLELAVTDEGPGFKWRRVRRAGPVGTQAPSGRGLSIINSYADRVQFNRRGNQITVWLRK